MKPTLLLTGALLLAGAGSALAQWVALPHSPVTVNRPVAAEVASTLKGQRLFTGREERNAGQLPAPLVEDKLRRSLFGLGPGDSVGYTRYDFQTNGAMHDRIINWGANGPNGIVASLYYMAATDAATDTRGSYGAIRFDAGGGLSWSPANLSEWTRAEDKRSGFNDIDQMSGTLVMVSHNGSDVNFVKEQQPASGTFTTTSIPNSSNGTWPRIAVSGNTVHVIWTIPADIEGERHLFYDRSTDGGNNWDGVIDLTDSFVVDGQTRRLPITAGGDAYDIDANGDHAVIWYHDLSQIVQIRSEDGGATWDRENAIALFRTQHAHIYVNHPDADSMLYQEAGGGDSLIYRSDTVAVPGEGFDLQLDADGTVHGVFPYVPTFYTRTDETGSDNSDTSDIGSLIDVTEYNYTDIGLRFVTVPPDNNGITTSDIANPQAFDNSEQYLDARGLTGGFCRWPKIGRTANGGYVIGFASAVMHDTIVGTAAETDGPRPYLFSHLYAVYSADGQNWMESKNLSPNGVDCQYPSTAAMVDNDVYIAYQEDTFPGDFLTSSGTGGSGLHPDIASAIKGYAMPLSQIAAVNDRNVAASGTMRLLSSNPVNATLAFSYSIDRGQEISVRLVDVLGRTVATPVALSQLTAGERTASVDVSNVQNGIYYLTLQGQGGTVVERVSIMH